MTAAPTARPRTASLLWALRSRCNIGCRYCYFGTIDAHLQAPPTGPGALSHLSRDDLPLADITAFVDSLPGSRVGRIFLAGGEPLIWAPSMQVVAGIKRAGVQVVLCTNGLALNRPAIVEQILALGVEAVSVSLDTPDPGYHDTYRPAHNPRQGHAEVLSGLRALVAARGQAPWPRVGIYAAIGRGNLDAIVDVAVLAAELGCDYVVPQPISLPTDHPLHTEMSLTSDHTSDLERAFTALHAAALPLHLPSPQYLDRFLAVTRTPVPQLMRGCFGGTDLLFIEPDGSVWDCPSYLKIAATVPHRRRSIRHTTAADLVGPPRPRRDCALLSRDCVSMIALMGFDAVLAAREVSTS